jgi:UDP-N-acetylglucosamine transferase subunit ALG13
VLVVVGTDHHRFDRIVRWTDEWLEQRSAPTTVVVQHGSSKTPALARGWSLLPHDELRALMRAAAVVVTHGGPATIMEVRGLGKMPIVVPRDPALGEHVDGHQQRFARRMGAEGLIRLCENQQQFAAALDRAVTDPTSMTVAPGEDVERVGIAVARVGRLLDEVIAGGRRSRRVTAPVRSAPKE